MNTDGHRWRRVRERCTRGAVVLVLSILSVADAAPKRAAGKKLSYPKIIQMEAAPGAPVVESGKIVSSEIGGLDLRFLREATTAGLLQAYLGELANAKGSAEQVRRIGGSFAATQAEETAQLQRLAARKGVTVPLDPAAARANLAGDVASLDGLKFDKAVLDHLVAANRLAVSAYEAGARSQDQDIRAFVGQMLPVAKARLQLASKMAGAQVRAAGVPQFRTGAPPATR